MRVLNVKGGRYHACITVVAEVHAPRLSDDLLPWRPHRLRELHPLSWQIVGHIIVACSTFLGSPQIYIYIYVYIYTYMLYIYIHLDCYVFIYVYIHIYMCGG